jgi:hypothetical protein
VLVVASAKVYVPAESVLAQAKEPVLLLLTVPAETKPVGIMPQAKPIPKLLVPFHVKFVLKFITLFRETLVLKLKLAAFLTVVHPEVILVPTAFAVLIMPTV